MAILESFIWLQFVLVWQRDYYGNLEYPVSQNLGKFGWKRMFGVV